MCVCVYICMSVCLSDNNFRKTLLTNIVFAHSGSRQYGSSWYIKVIGSRSRSQNRKRSRTGTHATDASVSGQIHLRARSVKIPSPITRRHNTQSSEVCVQHRIFTCGRSNGVIAIFLTLPEVITGNEMHAFSGGYALD